MVTKRVMALILGAAPLTMSQVCAQESPRLVVLISVDQMRADYLDRFADRLEHGLADVSRNGLKFTNTHHAHPMTETAPGHATLVTGVHPARTGVVSNEWWDRIGQARAYAADDPDVEILGAPLSMGRSPALLLRTTIGDWLKSTSPNSKVYSVAIKDRVSVLMGGKQPDDAYWYDSRTGRYVTSSFYAGEYPEWLNAFNEMMVTPENVGRTWQRLWPEESYTASRADSFPAEHDGIHIVFPHAIDLADTLHSPYVELIHTPFGDQTTISLAQELVVQEGLGEDEQLDLLFLGLSSADYIGHRYGPFSQEVEDYYLRLDQMLGEFMAFLDDRIGRENYVTILTADHGVVRLPEYSSTLGEPGQRVSVDDFREELVAGLTMAVRELEIYATPIPMIMYPLGLVLRFEAEEGDEVSEEQMRRVREIVAEHLSKAEVIEDVFTYDELLAAEVERGAIADYLKSFHPDRAADIVIQYKEHNTFPPTLVVNHGSPYTYDTHVPFIVVAAGLNPGVVDRRVWSVDIAPSLAAMLGISAPGDLDGSVIQELADWRTQRGTER